MPKHDIVKSIKNRTYKLKHFAFSRKYLEGHDLIKDDTRYYVVYREDPYAGLGSHMITALGHFSYAEKNELIPVVDLKNFINPYINFSQIGRKNAWDYYFLNPVVGDSGCLDSIYKDGNYVCCGGGAIDPFPGDCLRFNDEPDIWKEWNRLYKKYMPVRPEIEADVDRFVKDNFAPLSSNGKKIAGVLLRGTDYVSIKPPGHPVQPSIDQAIADIEKHMSDWGVDHLFLVTEDIEIREALLRKFGDMIIVPDVQMYSYKSGKYLGEIRNKRRNDSYLHGREYLMSLMLLGKCDYFIAGRTSGSSVVCVMADGFEDTFFWNLGLY